MTVITADNGVVLTCRYGIECSTFEICLRSTSPLNFVRERVDDKRIRVDDVVGFLNSTAVDLHTILAALVAVIVVAIMVQIYLGRADCCESSRTMRGWCCPEMKVREWWAEDERSGWVCEEWSG